MILQAIINKERYFSIRNLVYLEDKNIIRIKSRLLLLSYISLLSRFTRQKIHQIIVHEKLLIVLIRKKFLFYDKNGVLLSEIKIKNGSRPLRQGVEIIGNHLYYGEYWTNKKRVPVKLYKVNLQTYEIQVVCEFNNVRHIHAVQKDILFSNKVLVCTGDSDTESGIHQVDINNGSLETICQGNQDCRAVSLLQVDSQIFWGSDSPNRVNSIYSIDRNSQNSYVKICNIEGPAYYSVKLSTGDMYISTAIENKVRHKAVIYKSCDTGNTWTKYKQYKKDIWPIKLFGYGVIEFPSGLDNSDKLEYTTVGLR